MVGNDGVDQQSWLLDPERRFFEGAEDDVPHMALLTQATLAVAAVVLEFDQDKCEPEWLAMPVWLLANMGFRTARSAALSIGAGYSSEALGPWRRLAEMHARILDFEADATGRRALDWMRGRPTRPGRLVDRDLWGFLSPSAHADGEHLRWMSERDPMKVHMFPERDSRDTVIAVGVALCCRDIAGDVRRIGREPVDARFDSLNQAIEAALEVIEARASDVEVEPEPPRQ